MAGARDAEHLLAAAQAARTIITCDKDYIELHVAWQRWATALGMPSFPPHAGILIIQDHWVPSTAAREIALFLSSGRPLVNHLYHYVLGHQWVKPYP